jgi:hypothetical protein
MSGLWVTADELGDYSYTQYAEEACKTASYILWTMSGRKFNGITTVTERYVCAKRAYRMGASSKNYYATLVNGEVYNVPMSDFDQYAELVADGLSPESRIKLRGRPVTKIHTIRTRDGKIVDPSGYYLVDHSTIQATAGVPWTPCNIEVTYSYGAEVPVAGKMAARTLAIEFAKLWSDDETCALPQRVTSVSRQGVSYTLLDSQDFIAELRTGLYAIDLFIKSVNPDGAKSKARVFTPDQPRARRYTPKAISLAADTTRDIVVVQGNPGTKTLTYGLQDVDVFFDQAGWTPSVTLRNYSGSKSVLLDSSNIVLNSVAKTVTISVPYADAYKALGMVDPGTWTLYATKTVGGVENVSELEVGNLQIKLYS